MVIVRLRGGLGNQFFQYAAGRAVASQHQVPLKFDISYFGDYPGREFRLDHFNIVGEIATSSELDRLTKKNSRRLIRRMWGVWQKRLPYYQRSVYEQQGHTYDPNFQKAPAQVYLDGYWQSEKFFEHIAGAIRAELTVKKPLDGANKTVYRQIEQTESVSLHIRRGDYVTNPATHQLHGLCSLEYYATAVNKLTQTVKQPHFFVFSDDITWARKNLHVAFATTFVDHNDDTKEYEDLRLMRHCKHHIIANSSFSWWGAWLSNYPQKIVIAPQKWFNVAYDTTDLIPEAWLRL